MNSMQSCTSLLDFFLHLRISKDQSQRYSQRLINMGYLDSVCALQRDAILRDIETVVESGVHTRRIWHSLFPSLFHYCLDRIEGRFLSRAEVLQSPFTRDFCIDCQSTKTKVTICLCKERDTMPKAAHELEKRDQTSRFNEKLSPEKSLWTIHVDHTKLNSTENTNCVPLSKNVPSLPTNETFAHADKRIRSITPEKHDIRACNQVVANIVQQRELQPTNEAKVSKLERQYSLSDIQQDRSLYSQDHLLTPQSSNLLCSNPQIEFKNASNEYMDWAHQMKPSNLGNYNSVDEESIEIVNQSQCENFRIYILHSIFLFFSFLIQYSFETYFVGFSIFNLQ